VGPDEGDEIYQPVARPKTQERGLRIDYGAASAQAAAQALCRADDHSTPSFPKALQSKRYLGFR
jgi:hypothetical protein